jgi:hypothetical protein
MRSAAYTQSVGKSCEFALGKLCLGVRSCFESKDGMGANPFVWTILGVSHVVSYSWRIRWPLNNRNHTISLQDHRWGVGGRGMVPVSGSTCAHSSGLARHTDISNRIDCVSRFESKPREWNILESKPGGRGATLEDLVGVADVAGAADVGQGEYRAWLGVPRAAKSQKADRRLLGRPALAPVLASQGSAPPEWAVRLAWFLWGAGFSPEYQRKQGSSKTESGLRTACKRSDPGCPQGHSGPPPFPVEKCIFC